ncbi:MAG: RidA family protein, partial [Rhodospirillaceae bacterium]|nr:RidA family protein [Rhodospirillaceae bacterium]
MRRHALQAGHWRWPIEVGNSQGVRDGEMVFVGGQADLSPSGEVGHAGDLCAQTTAALDHMAAVLVELDADVNDVVKLVVFYRDRGDADEAGLLAAIRARFPDALPPALAAVPLPSLGLPGLEVVIEAIAMRGTSGDRLLRTASNPEGHWDWPFSHGLRCGELVFVGTQMPLDRTGGMCDPGDPVAQAQINIENLGGVLAGFGAEPDDVCRINTYYLGHGTAKDWAEAGRIRGHAFTWPGPVGTGVPVPALFPDGLTQRQEAFAMIGADGVRLARTALRPEGHWDWPVPVNFQQIVRVGRMIFIGGQISAAGIAEVVHPGDLSTQIHECLGNIEATLKAVGAGMADIVKLNVFYKGGDDPDELY